MIVRRGEIWRIVVGRRERGPRQTLPCVVVAPPELHDYLDTVIVAPVSATGKAGPYRIAARIEGITPHTLRHTFASVAGDLGFSELTIAALLGHAPRGVTQGYVHIDEALKLAATRTCEEIAGLLIARDCAPTSRDA